MMSIAAQQWTIAGTAVSALVLVSGVLLLLLLSISSLRSSKLDLIEKVETFCHAE